MRTDECDADEKNHTHQFLVYSCLAFISERSAAIFCASDLPTIGGHSLGRRSFAVTKSQYFPATFFKNAHPRELYPAG
jgi:hypothetical protein